MSTLAVSPEPVQAVTDSDNILTVMKARRMQLGFSQHALARRVGKHQVEISHFENGWRELDDKTAGAIAEALGLADPGDLQRAIHLHVKYA